MVISNRRRWSNPTKNNVVNDVHSTACYTIWNQRNKARLNLRLIRPEKVP
ncbi:hypothetical protein KSS87_013501 [Heliosperma pusillum]|nr:hypothetical protein KSS87_013501 [Heliosperma pusillum]